MKKYFLILGLLCHMALCGCNDSIPCNEIHYTSSDGKIVELNHLISNSDDPFMLFMFGRSEYPLGEGVSVVSNVYENGEGVITCDGDITTIGDYAFHECKSLTSITIPNSVTTIGEGAFDRCYNLKSITIPDSVITIGDMAFGGCWSLTSITIPGSVTTIGDRTFQSCKGLTNITIPDSVTTIEGGAFSNCYSLTSITIPDSVTSIGGGVFEDCSSLTSIYCKAVTPPSLKYNALSIIGTEDLILHDVIYIKNSDIIIYVPEESVEAYKTHKNWGKYADQIIGYNFSE